MTNVIWESILGQLNEEFIEEAVLSYEQPVSAASDEKETIMNHKVKKTSKCMLSIAIAAVMMMALAVVGFATDAIPSFFAALGSGDAFYQVAGEKSDKTKETVEPVSDQVISLTREESYYDGENVVLAYTLSKEGATVEFGFGPDDENFENLFTPPENNQTNMSLLWHDYILAAADFAKAEATLLKVGAVGLTVHYVGIGDHLKLGDGSDPGPMIGGEVDGTIILRNQEELPEQAKNLDEITLCLGVKQYVAYYYVEGDIVSYYCPVVEAEWIPFTIENVNHQ